MSTDGPAKRQQVLAERLEILCHRAATEILPLRIEEIWGFGSFFRRKERPNDIDLGLKIGRNEGADKLWRGFNDLMGKAITQAEGRRDEFPTPAEALRAILPSPDADELWETFSKWLIGLKWDVIDREAYRYLGPHQPYHAHQVTIRILTRGLAGISIPEYVSVDQDFPLLTDALTLIWSRSKPDVKANLGMAFASDNLRNNLIIELEGFDGQLSDARFEIQIKEGLFKSIISAEAPKIASEASKVSQEKWLVSRAIKLFPQLDPAKVEDIITKSYETSFTLNEPVKPKSTEYEPAYAQMATQDLQSLAERKRANIKEVKWETFVVREVLDSLLAWKAGTLRRDSFFSGYTAEEWVTQSALNAFDKKPVSERYIRAALRKLGLPEEKVVFEKIHARYALASDDNIRREIASGNGKLEAERKFSSAARREAKKFNVHLNASIQVDENLQPQSAYIHYYVDSKNRGEKSMKEAEWLRECGFKVNEGEWGTSADLHLEMRGLRDSKQVASHIRSLLSASKK